MPRAIKRKRTEIAEDDVLRRFVTFHTEEVAKEMKVKLKSKERAEIVEMIVDFHGENLTAFVRNTAEMIFAGEEDGDEDEDEDEDD